MKFGGAALADGAGVRRACELITAAPGARPVVVVSAHLGVTSLLEELAHGAAAGRFDLDALRIRHRSLLAQLSLDPELLNRYFAELREVLDGIVKKGFLGPGELDFVLSFGERMSSRVVAAALRRSGAAATPIDAFDLGLVSDSRHGAARPLPGIEESVRRSLSQVDGIGVVTGFLAKDEQGRLTTLGRNGSDLTAAIVAEAVNAFEVVLWKDVPGVLTADPELVPEARLVPHLSYAEAAELARHGAEVLHPEALVPVQRADVRVRVCGTRSGIEPCTIIDSARTCGEVLALSAMPGLAGFTLDLGEGAAAGKKLARFSRSMSERGIEARYFVARAGKLSVFAPKSSPFAEVVRSFDASGCASDHVAITLVGRGGPDLGARAVRELQMEGITPHQALFTGQDLSQTLLLEEHEGQRALRVLHRALLRVSSGSRAVSDLP